MKNIKYKIQKEDGSWSDWMELEEICKEERILSFMFSQPMTWEQYNNLIKTEFGKQFKSPEHNMSVTNENRIAELEQLLYDKRYEEAKIENRYRDLNNELF